jgi:hypothetical protein
VVYKRAQSGQIWADNRDVVTPHPAVQIGGSALVFGPYLLRGLVDLVLAATRDLPAAMTALALCGVGTSTGMVTYTSFLQAHVRDPLRGRVFASFDMIWQTGRLASLALGGAIAGTLGIQAIYLLGGLLVLLAGTTGLTGLRHIQAGAAFRRQERSTLPRRTLQPGPGPVFVRRCQLRRAQHRVGITRDHGRRLLARLCPASWGVPAGQNSATWAGRDDGGASRRAGRITSR